MRRDHHTLQRVFDRVAAHLLAQGERSYDARADLCRIRFGALRDPIGGLLTDAAYTEALEGQDVLRSQLLRRALAASGVDISHFEVRRLLAELVRLHDQVAPARWRRELAFIASDFEMAMTTPHQGEAEAA